MKKWMEMLCNHKGVSSYEMAAVITVVGILTYLLAPGIMRIIDNAEKNSDYTNAHQLVKATIQTCIFDEEYYGFKGDIDINDEELSEIEEAILCRLKLLPQLKSQRGCHFIIRIESLGNIEIWDDQNHMIFPTVDEVYKKH